MSTDAALPVWLPPSEQLRCAREVLTLESQSVAEATRRLDTSFCHAADCLYRCRGNVIVTESGRRA